METLVVVADYGNRHGSSPCRGFREINCRAFETGGGALLPTPIQFSSIPSPKTPKPAACDSTPNSLSGNGKLLKRSVRSSPIAINLKGGKNECSPFSERWAGPAYSNSPPPSSLPIPKFWMKPKRSVSLELPRAESEIAPYPVAKSAPASPTRESKHSAITFMCDDDTATKTLRRILNLDD